MISSTSNSQVKEIVKLLSNARARNKSGTFVVEGIRMFVEIPDDRHVKTYVSKSFLDDVSGDVEKLILNRSYEVVDDNVFKQMSDTITPQGIMSIVKKNDTVIQDILGGRTYIILENLQDPGNLGTILRTAEGAGVAGIIMNRGTVDIFNPKVVRSTMGAIFRVPFVYVDDFDNAVKDMKQQGIKIYAAHLDGKTTYSDADYTKASAFMIGNEGNGLTEQAAALADELIIIPMAGKVESLNAANAATILMYEAFRQKGFK